MNSDKKNYSGEIVKITSLIDVICAAHLSSYVDGLTEGLGGLMLVSPPEGLKTSMLKVLTAYPNALVLTDINTQQLTKLRDSVSSGQIRSLVLLDLQKLYERDPNTAMNAEGNIRALACEGFIAASFQSQEPNRMVARCVVLGAMTSGLLDKHFERWKSTGFARRFLWPTFALDDPEILVDSILRWERLPLSLNFILPPASRSIPFRVDRKERDHLRHMVRHQYGKTEPLHMACKIYAVLKWHYGNKRQRGRAMAVMEDFAESLGREGAHLEIDA